MASSSSSFGITCPSLPDEIWIEIFIYLPLTSIYKFKSVSKVWLSILSNPNFLTKWFQFNNESLPWMQYYTITTHDYDANPLTFKSAYPYLHSEFISRNENHGFSFEFLLEEGPFEGDDFFLLGSSNGLVLCLSVKSDDEGQHHVCNPLTQKWVSIPSPPGYQASQYDVNGIFSENPLSNTCCYKVICIPSSNTPSKKFNVDMFCSDLGVWKSFEVSCDEYVVRLLNDSENVVILNGVLYWIEGGNRMVVYNLNQNNGSDGHRCSLIKLPDEEFGEYEFGDCNTRNLGESEGCVCYSRTGYTRRDQVTVSVWVLDEVNWQILHKDISVDISVDNISDQQSFHTFRDTAIQVLGFSPVDRNVVLLGYKHWVLEFDIETRSFEELCYPSPSSNRRFSNASWMSLPFVLKPMPTVLPSPSWIDA